MSTRCSIIVVAYNSAEELAAWPLGLSDEGVELIVVDNGSSDDSAAVAAGLGATVFKIDENLGWSRACNLGAAKATGEVLLFVNPDAALTSVAVTALAAKALAARRAVVPRFVNPDGSAQSFYFRLPTPLSGLFLYFNTGRRLDRILGSPVAKRARYHDRAGPGVPVAHGGGACTAIPRSLFAQMGGFDETMWLFFSDTDLSRRMAAAGAPIDVAWEVSVTHVGGSGVQW